MDEPFWPIGFWWFALTTQMRRRGSTWIYIDNSRTNVFFGICIHSEKWDRRSSILCTWWIKKLWSSLKKSYKCCTFTVWHSFGTFVWNTKQIFKHSLILCQWQMYGSIILFQGRLLLSCPSITRNAQTPKSSYWIYCWPRERNIFICT